MHFKRIKLLTLVIAFIVSHMNVHTQENDVVLQYDQLTLEYTYADGDIDSYGPGLDWSKRHNNLLLGVNLGYAWIQDSEVKILQTGAELGYVYELSETLHFVPALGASFAMTRDSEEHANSCFFIPSLSLNYAATDSLELSLGLAYAEPFSTNLNGEDISGYMEGAFTGSIGTEYAISTNIGFIARFLISEHSYGFGIGISFHH
jgi:hypothetical protein